MDYKLYITRAPSWAENDGYEIPISEWLAFIQHDPELRLASEYGPYFAIWKGDSHLHQPWFNWDDGNITTKSPDEQIIRKMVQIAQALRGTVQGEEGERYSVRQQRLVWRRQGEDAVHRVGEHKQHRGGSGGLKGKQRCFSLPFSTVATPALPWEMRAAADRPARTTRPDRCRQRERA